MEYSNGNLIPILPKSQQFNKNFKYNWSDRVFSSVLSIRCSKTDAELHKKKFGSGSKGKCIKYNDEWITPTEFEARCGLVNSRDWKRSIQYEGRKLQCLIEDGILRPHSKCCSCTLCCDGIRTNNPVRYMPSKIVRTKSLRNKFKKRKIADDNSKSTIAFQSCDSTQQSNDGSTSKSAKYERCSKETSPLLLFNEASSRIVTPEYLDDVATKINEMKKIVEHLKDDFDEKLLKAKQEMEQTKIKEIEAHEIKSKLIMDRRIAEEKHLMDIKLQEALAQVRQEMSVMKNV